MIIKNIPKVIQEKLRSKELALSRKKADANQVFTPENLTFSDMVSRTVFVRMISDKSYFEVLEGGPFDTLAGEKLFGFNNIYDKTSNGQIRGISGIKNISVEYKGGYKGIRKADVSWVVNSLDDLNRYEEHFLTNGVSVLLEWGWVYKDSIKNPKETFFRGYDIEGAGEKGPIKREAYINPSRMIYSNKGDYDAMAGVVSNFNYKLNEDGGFDCTTSISSVGINFLPVNDLKKDTSEIRLFNEEDGQKSAARDTLLNCIINLNEVIVYEYMGYNDGPYWRESIDKDHIEGVPSSADMNDTNKMLLDIDQNFRKRRTASGAKKYEVVCISKNYAKAQYLEDSEIFVRWGWFEDNIISRYTAVQNNEGDISSLFRSVELKVDEETGEPSKRYRNIRIRNSPFLLPKDITKFFLPGHIIDLAKITDFRKFQSGEQVEKVMFSIDLYKKLLDINSGTNYEFSKIDDQYGVLRNVMINTKEIQKAFGIKVDKLPQTSRYHLDTDIVEPPETLTQAMNNLLDSFNENFYRNWNFRIVEDPYTKNSKIVDILSSESLKSRNYTIFKGDLPDGSNSLSSPSNEVERLGIYSFPSFKLNSMVKSQELEFKIPDAKGYISMFSTNLQDTMIANSEDEDTGLSALASSYNQSLDGDSDLKNLKTLHEYAPVGGHKVGNSDIPDQNLTSIPPAERDDTTAESNSNIALSEGVDSQSDEGSENNEFEVTPVVSNGSFSINSQKKFDITDKVITSPKLISKLGGKAFASYWKVFSPKEEEAVPIDNSSYFDKPASVDPMFSSEMYVAAATVALEDKDVKNYNQVADHLNGYIDPKLFEVLGDDKSKFYKLTMKEGMSPILNTRIKNIHKDNIAQHKDYIIPSELSLEIDGMGGLYPADILHVDYISSKYGENLVKSGSSGENLSDFVGPRTFFQIFNLTQTVDENGWTTSLQTKMRFNSQAFDGMSLPELKTNIIEAERPEVTEDPDDTEDRYFDFQFEDIDESFGDEELTYIPPVTASLVEPDIEEEYKEIEEDDDKDNEKDDEDYIDVKDNKPENDEKKDEEKDEEDVTPNLTVVPQKKEVITEYEDLQPKEKIDVYTGSEKQNDILYAVREDLRPLYFKRSESGRYPNWTRPTVIKASVLEGRLGIDPQKLNPNDPKSPWDPPTINKGWRGAHSFNERKDFYHKYIDPKNESGAMTVNSFDGSVRPLVNDDDKVKDLKDAGLWRTDREKWWPLRKDQTSVSKG